jgi:sulfopyruvate decarboxylase subunit alpha
VSVAVERALAAARGLDRAGLDLIAYVPSNTVAPIIEYFRERNGVPGSPRAFPVAREEEAVGIIGGANVVGARGALIMQDNGFGNSVTALATWAVAYHVPLPILANTRGGLGEYNSMIHTISGAVPTILASIGVPVFHLNRRDSAAGWESAVYEAERHAWMTHRPVVVLMEFWDGAAGGHRA